MEKKLLTAVSVSLPFRTAVSIGLTVDKVTFVRSTMKPRLFLNLRLRPRCKNASVLWSRYEITIIHLEPYKDSYTGIGPP